LKEPTAFGAFMAVYRSEVNQYLYYFIRSALFRQVISEVNTTTINQITQNNLRSTIAPLPPLAEQHRIVAKVDELMALCDRLEAARAERERSRDKLTAASLARLNAPDPDTFQDDARFALGKLPALITRPDQIKQLRQTILNLAVRGRLVAQDPNDEPASELLKRIAKEKARLVKEGRLKKSEPVAELTGLDHGLPEPDGWAVTNLQSLCNSVTDGDHLPPPKAEAGIPFLVIGNVRSQRIDFAGSRFVSAQYYEALDPTRSPRSGDLLYTLVGSYGIPVIVRDDRPFCVQRHIGILRPSKLIDVNFLARAMESRLAFDQATICATGIAQKTVPLSGLRKLLLPLAPLAEQHRIVAKVDELMALCDRLEASLAAGESTRHRLLDAALAEALAAGERDLERAA
jgi:type I restriction enzyme S subunit